MHLLFVIYLTMQFISLLKFNKSISPKMPSYAALSADPCSSPGPLPALALFVLPVNMAGPVVARGGHVTLMGSRKYSIA